MDVSDIFFFLLGEGEGEREARDTGGGGGSVFIENPRGGGAAFRTGMGARGPGGCLLRIGDFWGGAKMSTKKETN